MATIRKDGYRQVQAWGNPRACAYGRVFEHVLIAERVIGRFLPVGVVVHHVDENKANNRNDNLVVLQNQAEHMALHRRLRALRAGRDPWAPVRSHKRKVLLPTIEEVSGCVENLTGEVSLAEYLDYLRD